MEVKRLNPVMFKNITVKSSKTLRNKLSRLVKEREDALARGYCTTHVDNIIAEIREILSERRAKKRKNRKSSKDFIEKTKFVTCTRDKIKKPLENYHLYKV